MFGVHGLELVANWVSQCEATRLLATIDGLPWNGQLRRRVQHYGLDYDYRRRSLTGQRPLPEWAAEVADRLVRDGHFASRPDQVTVNEYLPGQGIAAHVDRPDFGPVVAAMTLGAPVTMDFSHGDVVSIRLAERSLLVLDGAARAEWKHGIAPRRTDLVDGLRVPRGRRVSVTFRTLRP